MRVDILGKIRLNLSDGKHILDTSNEVAAKVIP